MFTRIAAFVAIFCLASPWQALAAKPKIAPPAQPGPGDWRIPDPQNLLVIETNKGRVIVEMYPEVAPAHVAQVRALALKHFYDGQTFFRVVDGFMDQTGDPTNTGTGGSDLPNLKAEFTFKRNAATPFVSMQTVDGGEVGFIGALPVASQPGDLMAMTASGTVSAWGLFCPGVAGMARANDPDSANSQFYLMRDAYPTLNRKYTVWGRALIGLDVIQSIKLGEPVDPPQDKIVTLRLAADLPEAERPKLKVLDTRSAYFRTELAKDMAARAIPSSPCDVNILTKLN